MKFGELEISTREHKIQVFFLNQKFITQGAVADCGSCIVTTYRIPKLHNEKRKKKQRKQKKSKKTTDNGSGTSKLTKKWHLQIKKH